MDSNYEENQSEDLSTLQAGFNELIRNAYLQGFKDGQEFVFDFISGSNDKEKALSEAEKILRSYS
ncbi:hypothetical protein ACFLXY_03395 [Chloroflexota bacterium]